VRLFLFLLAIPRSVSYSVDRVCNERLFSAYVLKREKRPSVIITSIPNFRYVSDNNIYSNQKKYRAMFGISWMFSTLIYQSRTCLRWWIQIVTAIFTCKSFQNFKTKSVSEYRTVLDSFATSSWGQSLLQICVRSARLTSNNADHLRTESRFLTKKSLSS